MTVEEISPELFLWELYNVNGVHELDVALHIAVKFRYCTPPYVWQSADIPVEHPQLGETPIERVAILIGERVELVEQSSTIRTGTKAKNGGRR